MSHIIKSLNFGPSVPEQVNPLDGRSQLALLYSMRQQSSACGQHERCSHITIQAHHCEI